MFLVSVNSVSSHAYAGPILFWTTQQYARVTLPWAPAPSPVSTPPRFLLSTLHLPPNQRESSSLRATLFQFKQTSPRVHSPTTFLIRLSTLLALITPAPAPMPQAQLKLLRVANPKPAHPASPPPLRGNHNKDSCSQFPPLDLPPD